MSKPSLLKVLSSSLLLAVILLSLPAVAAERETIDGVLHVRNGTESRDGVQHLRLTETWRAGGPNDDILFGLITQVAEDKNGDLLVLDGQLSQVHVYSRDGERKQTLFHEGDGPGEIRGPRDVVILGDGRIGAVQEVPGKLVIVDRANNPAGELRIGGAGVSHGGFCQTFSAFTGGDLLLMAGFVQSPGPEPGHMTQTSFLSGFDLDGNETAKFCVRENDIDFQAFTFYENRHMAAFWWNAAVGPDGKVYVAPSLDSYEIHVFDSDGTLERVIERDYEPLKRTPEEKQYFEDVVKAIYGEVPFEIGVDVSDTEPVITTMQRGLRVHDDGTLWILTTRGFRDQEAGVMATFDVFDLEGEFLRQVAVHFDADARHDGVFLLGDDRAAVVKGFVDAGMAQFTGGRMTIDLDGDEEATMEVVGCRLGK